MERVSVELQHCYGIKALKYDFEFTKDKKAFAIYAPNGIMKSSLALTFKDLANAASGAFPRDRIFADRKTIANVLDENGAPIKDERVLVIESYDDNVSPSEKTSTLLVEPKLREKYASLQVKVEEAKSTLLNSIKQQTKSKVDLEAEISTVLTKVPNDFKRALKRVKDEVREQADAPFSRVQWDNVFAAKIVEALNTKNLKSKIAEYISRYDELIQKSAFFKKGIFDHYNAEQIANQLSKNGFFKASHTVLLKSIGKTLEITAEDELQKIIEGERKAILEDAKLVAMLTEVQGQLDRNAELRAFRTYLMDNMYILPHLNNIDKFKEDVIKSYLKTNQVSYDRLLDVYEEVREEEERIFKAAVAQRTQWEEVIEIFNNRFAVPFKLHVANRADVVAGKDKIMQLGFTYQEGEESKEIERKKLLEYLSNGEKKAFYILNVIFEIERRKKDNIETLIIVDDLADSFDYQNKYAIVEYLRGIAEVGVFRQIILTHNFDFLRTIEGRLVQYSSCLIALKSKSGIELTKIEGIKNIFAKKWKPAFFTNDRMKIASIAFLRNLVEYSRGESDPAYPRLTSLLHWRHDTASLSVKDLDDLYRGETGEKGSSPNHDRAVIDVINASAEECVREGAGFNLENKVVIAIATRLAAERFMVQRLSNDKFWREISSNQTWELVREFKRKFPSESESISVLDRVLLMTPENIHLNSFMYEPLIDMNVERLIKLYAEVKNLEVR